MAKVHVGSNPTLDSKVLTNFIYVSSLKVTDCMQDACKLNENFV